jgi:threonyl-tRNA synthetase
MDYRVFVDSRSEKIGYKIREAQSKKIPYMLVVGDKEIEDEKVAVRERFAGDLGVKSVEEFIELLKKDSKTL